MTFTVPMLSSVLLFTALMGSVSRPLASMLAAVLPS